MPTAIAGLSPTPATQPVHNLGEMSPEQFLQLLITQLQNQDPFEPVKNQDLLNQISSVRQLQGSMDLDKTLNTFATQQQVMAGGAMIGKHVEGLNSSLDHVAGTVTSLNIKDGQGYLELDTGQEVALKDVLSVTAAAPAAAAAAPPATAG